MKNVALVGLGRWGKNILRELVNLHTEVTVLLNTPNTEKEQWLRENYPSVAYTYSKEDIIENPDITHVCVATPMGTHFDVAKDFIVAGKKVFLEKPITIESKEGRKFAVSEMKRVVKPNGYILVYVMSTYDEFHKEMIKNIDFGVEVDLFFSPSKTENSFYIKL